MTIQKTNKEILSSKDILEFIDKHERNEVPTFNKLWAYYEGENTAILGRKLTDPNNPDNRITVSYGRKLVTTFVGYGYRPRWITIKASTEQDASLENDVDASDDMVQESLTNEEKYVEQLKETFNLNNEHIKTNRAGRNFAIFGVSYEVCYIDGVLTTDTTMTVKAEVKFFTVKPTEMILLYDYAPEPKKKIAIRYYRIDDNNYKVEVYYKNKIETYDRIKNDSGEWELTPDKVKPIQMNFFGEIPVAAYYFGDEMLGIFKEVLRLIDAHDVLFSDSMNEFDRFAFAYLIMKKFGITDPIKMKTPGMFSNVLANLKKKRIFENLPVDADIKFLTKDIPTQFIQFMKDALREQIHIQSHIPDFTSDKMAGASGKAIKRLLFDFENLVSSSDADFDLGLIERINLITKIYELTGRATGTSNDFIITHKRNLPDDTLENAQVAGMLKAAGMSSYLVTSALGSELCPDVQAELLRQQKEAEELMEMNPLGTDMGLGEETQDPNAVDGNLDVNNE